MLLIRVRLLCVREERRELVARGRSGGMQKKGHCNSALWASDSNVPFLHTP